MINPLRILAIDPGSRKAGYAVIEVIGKRFQFISAGTLDIYQGREFIDRLAEIPEIIKDLISEFRPDEVSVEALIYVKSPTALMKLAQTRGAMLASLSQTHKEKIFEYSPNLVKRSVTGHGHANKESVEKAVKMILGVPSDQKFDGPDATDALAIALCHAFHRNSTKSKIDEILSSAKKPLYKSKGGLASQLTHKIK